MNRLKRRYYFMRHGQSQANAEGFISSRITDGTREPALTKSGIEDVLKQATAFSTLHKSESFQVISSPFRRAIETTSIFCKALSLDYSIDYRLRERDFGLLDGLSSDLYIKVWENDVNGKSNHEFSVESLDSIIIRVRELVDFLERSSDQRSVIFCSHGDVASASLTFYAGRKLSSYRLFGAIDTADIREIVQGS